VVGAGGGTAECEGHLKSPGKLQIFKTEACHFLTGVMGRIATGCTSILRNPSSSILSI
jgi:hypothetical protein